MQPHNQNKTDLSLVSGLASRASWHLMYMSIHVRLVGWGGGPKLLGVCRYTCTAYIQNA